MSPSGIVQLWILLAAAAVRADHYDVDADTLCVDDNMSHVDALRDELKSLMDAHWPLISESFDGYYEPQGDAMSAMAARPMVGTSLRTRLANGFFHRPAVDQSSTVRYVTVWPMDAGHSDGTTATDSTVFRTEQECVTATAAARGDGRWLCVCYTTDYLDWVGQQLDEAPSSIGDAAEVIAECKYYKAVTTVLIVRAEDARPGDDVGQRTTAVVPPPTPSAADKESAWTPVDFDLVAGYRLERSANDHFSVHYGLVGSDVQVRCLDDPGKNLIKWKYQKIDHKTKSAIINTDSNELSIMGMEPADSKNYTCSLEMAAVKSTKNVKSNESYTHYIIAVEKPIYEIRGKATYKTNDINICTDEMTRLMRKQLPALLRAGVCPEGSTRYACNVIIETASCRENKKILVIEYSMTLNDKADVFTRIRTSKKGRNALYYQQIVAKISKVLAANLKKTLSSALIVSKFPLVETHFEPDREQLKINTFVSCVPGFGLREVFCAACSPHHYSPDRSAECLKCPKGFHQPAAGSDKCVKCPTPFASGCIVDEVLTSSNTYYVIGASIFLIAFVVIGSCFYCCRKQNKNKCLHNIRKIPGSVKRRFKLFKKKDLSQRFSSNSSKKSIIDKGKKIGKSMMSLIKKSKPKKIEPVIPFEIIHGKMGPNHMKN